MKSAPLATYLNDHLAGSVVAIGLLQSLEASFADDAGDRSTANIVAGVRREIEEERGMLEAMIARVGSGESGLRKAAGWFAERFAKAKLAVDDDRGGAFKRFEQAEVITLGIWGKRGLWRVLRAEDALWRCAEGVDLDVMIARSDSQYDRMETVRMTAARSALAPPT